MSCILDEIVVVKRSGQRVGFDGTKIAIAIKKAFDQVYDTYDQKKVNKVYLAVLDKITKEYQNRKTIQVEDIQDIIEETLINNKFKEVYLEFNNYRLKRTASRDAFSLKQQHKFVKAIEKVDFAIENNKNMSPLDLMYKFGSVMSKEFAKSYLIDSKYVRAHDEGSINIPALDVYALGMTSSACLNLSETKISSLAKFTDAVLEAIHQAKQEQYGEHIISNIDLLYKPVILKEFKQMYYNNLTKALDINGTLEYIDITDIDDTLQSFDSIYFDFDILNKYIKNNKMKAIFEDEYYYTLKQIEESIMYQIERLFIKISNFDYQTNNNRVTITLGCGTSKEEQLFSKNCLLILEKLDKLPKLTVVYQLDTNTQEEIYLQLSQLIADKKNICFTKHSNLFYLSNGIPLVMGQPLLSTITINLARLSIKNAKEGFKAFLKDLEEVMDLSKNELMQRFEFQASKYKENYKYLFENNLLLDSKKLEENQKIRKVIKNGVLCIDYVGLGDCICILKDKDNFEVEDADMALKIIDFMNNKIKQYTEEHKIQFVLSENRDKKVRAHLLAIDKSVFGQPYLLNKKDYVSFNDFIYNLKLDKNIELEIYRKMQALTCFKVNIRLQNNVKKINDYLRELSKNNLEYYQIKVGNNDD